MEIHLIPDKTAFIQLGTFVVVLAGLSYLVFKPLRKIIEERRDRTERLLNEAKEIEERIKRAAEVHEAMLLSARERALKEKEKIRQAGLDEEADIRARARAEAGAIINEARDGINKARAEALKELRKEIPSLAERIIEKLKGQ